MSLVHLAGFLFLTTLTLDEVFGQGEVLLPAENSKPNGAKTVDKRTNFRVPVDTPFDPNFWPARGRRSGDDADGGDRTDNCDENFLYDKDDLECLTEGKKPRRMDGDIGCYEGWVARPESDIANSLIYRLNNKKAEVRRHKKQRHFDLPQITLYGNGVYWDPDNSFGEKTKKEDVFWVARGKKNFL